MPTWAIRAFFCRPISHSLNTGSCRAYFAFAPYGAWAPAMCSGWRPCAHTPTLLRYCQQAIRATFVALSRPLGSIRALVAPISHSLNTALGLRLCARAGTLARIRLRSCAIAIRQYAQLLSPYLACCNQSLEIDDRITVLNYTNCIVLYCKSRQHRTYGHIVRSSINPSMCQLRSRRNACIHCPLGIFPYCKPHLHRTCYRIVRSYWNPSKC